MSDNILIRVRSYMGAGVDSSKYYNKTEVDDKIQRIETDIVEYVNTQIGSAETILSDINSGSGGII